MNLKITKSHPLIHDLLFPLFIGTLFTLMGFGQSLWLDEAITGLTSSQTLTSYFHTYAPHDFHPPLHYLITHFFIQIFGSHDWVIRLPSLLFFLGTIVIASQLASYYHPQARSITAILIATSPLLVYYAGEGRMYMMATFLVSLTFYFWQNLNQKYYPWFFALCLSLTLLTHYLTFFILPLFFLDLKKIRQYFPFILLSLIPYLFWLPTLSQQFQLGLNSSQGNWGEILGFSSWRNLLLIPIKFIFGRITFNSKLVYAVVSFFGVNLFFWTILNYSNFRQTKRLYLWIIIPIVLAILISFKLPVLNYFRFLYILPAIYILVSLGIVKIKNHLSQLALLLVFLGLHIFCLKIYLLSPEMQKESWKQAMITIKQENLSQLPLIITFPNPLAPVRWYAPEINQITILPNQLDQISDLESSSILFADYSNSIFDPKGEVLTTLKNKGYIETGFYQFNGVGKIRLLENHQIFANQKIERTYAHRI